MSNEDFNRLFTSQTTETDEQNNASSNRPSPDDDIYIFEEKSDADKPLGFFERFISIFFSPGKLTENIAAFPKLGAVSIYLILLTIVTAVLAIQISPIVMNALSIATAERYGVDFLNMNQSAQVAKQFSLIMFASGWASSLTGAFIGSAIGAIFMLLITKIMRGNANFKQYFALNLHRSVLAQIGGFVSSGLILATGSFMGFTSLAPIFMPTGNTLMPMFNLLSSIELFGIWSTVLLIIGLKKLNDNFSTAKAVTAGIIYYVFVLAFTTAISSSTVLIYDMAYRSLQQIQ